MEKIQNILFAKMYHIDHIDATVTEKIINIEDAKNYVKKVISDLIVIPNTKRFIVRSEGTEVINSLNNIISSLNEAAATSEATSIDMNICDDNAYNIANRLLRSEVNAKDMYENNLRIQITKGSLLQAFIETEDGYNFILSKIEHKPYIDREDMSKHYGLPYEKITLKCCSIQLDEEYNILEIKVSDTGSTIAKYWRSDFLELDEFVDNEKNTQRALTEINRVLNRNVKIHSEQDYMFLKQKLLGYFDNNASFKNTDMIDAVLGNYSPETDKINIDNIKEKLAKLPEEKHFDGTFEIDPKVIEKKSKQQIEISEDIELNFKKDIPDLKQRIKASIEDGEKLLKIYKINDNTFRMFK